MAHNRDLVFHNWRWNFSGWVHVVEHHPRMAASCKDAGDGLILHLRDQCELSLRFFVSKAQLTMGTISAGIEVPTFSKYQ